MKKVKMKDCLPKVIYFCDIPMDGDEEADWRLHEFELERLGVKVGRPKITTKPPFDENFDILFFDWGGMGSMGGNTIFQSFCQEIVKLAEECPSRMFVMASYYTERAMKECQAELSSTIGGAAPENIYLTIKDFAAACKKQGLLKKGRLVWS